MKAQQLAAKTCAYVILGCALALAPLVHARPLTPDEQRRIPLSTDLPGCDDIGILSTIEHRFADKESEYWDSSLTISGWQKIEETGYRSDGIDHIPRRFCKAEVTSSNNHTHKVIYSIIQNDGIIGFGPGVQWCVADLDRNWKYNPSCHAAGL